MNCFFPTLLFVAQELEESSWNYLLGLEAKQWWTSSSLIIVLCRLGSVTAAQVVEVEQV